MIVFKFIKFNKIIIELLRSLFLGKFDKLLESLFLFIYIDLRLVLLDCFNPFFVIKLLCCIKQYNLFYQF